MNVKISKEKVFWNTITDNKPSQTYFDEFVKRMQDSELKVNQINILTIQVVCTSRDITYIQIQHRDYVGYYYYNSIEKIANGSYVIQFKLDIWTTFTLPFLKNIKDNNVKVKTIRNHVLNLNSTNFTDEMLNNVPITWNKILLGGGATCTWRTHNEPTPTASYEYIVDLVKDGYFQKSYIQLKITRKDGKPIQPGYEIRGLPFANGSIYYVFKETTASGNLILYPVLIDEYDTNTYTDEIYMQLKDENHSNSFNKLRIYNSKRDLEELRTNAALSSKFIGIYVGQHFYLFHDNKNVYDKYSVGDKNYGVLTIPPNGLICKNELIFANAPVLDTEYGWMNFLTVDEQVPSLNYDERLHILASKAINLEYYGQLINPAYFYVKSETTNSIKSSFWYFTLTQQGFIHLRTPYNTWTQDVYTLPANLPVYEDEYIKYVNANKNQRDNQINIWKQQMGMGIAKNLWGFIAGGADAALKAVSGDFIGGVKQGITNTSNTAFGLADTILGYQNSLSSLNAQYADYKNVLGDTLNAGNILDTLRGFYSTRHLVDDDEYVYETAFSTRTQYRGLTKDTVRNLNNIIYLYGNFNPIHDTLDNLQPRNDFNYLLFEKEYLNQIFSKYINNNVPLEFYETIINTLSGGVRICKTNTP